MERSTGDTERAMSEENVEIVREMFDAWNRRDYAAAQEAFDPEVEVEVRVESDIDGTYRGYDGLRKMLRFWGAFATFRSDIEEVLVAGDEVFITAHHYGRGKSSAVDVETKNWQVFTMRDGRIGRYRIYGTRGQALEAAGLSE
jgi:ketosteroid isomerase-like protein